MKDTRSTAQRWADYVTEFSGSWTFIGVFSALCLAWIALNWRTSSLQFDPYPFLFLNWTLTVVSTLQNPVILLSQNRQNDTDRTNMQEVLARLDSLQQALAQLTTASRLPAAPDDPPPLPV